jgi:phosphatidylinositol-3,4,5-trisphosphate 3-phosphatase/dual-specificity protein phosphatase PTEN
LLDESHAEHYLVFNLSQRVYDYEKFHGRVVDWCGFPDHHGAPLPLLIRTVKAMHEFLMADPRNVVVVHCLAGKGRTGTVIVAFMLYVSLFRTPNAASVFFAAKRSTNHWGVTGPSQQRYVGYIHRLLSLGEAPTATLFVLSAVELRPVPQFSFGVGRTGCCAVLRVKTDNSTRTLCSLGRARSPRRPASTLAPAMLCCSMQATCWSAAILTSV